ncbi:ribosome maturation factor RimM [Xylanivirga thermophila]|jgi:16S rRNA processing protein RimM|uniref:ribosome maturation factor RimM n=1 Tax=Xylanivirga thermophila TaxID=2496273 RepID=UPI001FB3ED07|nr:ribosome maturation factor RimM [Xylanivirga thermophila]
MKMVEYLCVGFVVKPQGIKGEAKVLPLTDDITRFNDLNKVYLYVENGYHELSIERARYTKDFVYLKFAGYNNRDQVERLRNEELWIPREMSVKLPDNVYFIADIIDCSVYTLSGIHLGVISDVLQTGSNDVYVIEGKYGQILIPALKKVVKQVLLQEKKIRVDQEQLEGLLPDGI